MRKEPNWISKSLAVAIHEHLLAEHGGLAGFRDEGMLESALVSPQYRFHYGEDDLVSLAANYAYAFSRNHPFNDGNKRVTFVLAVTFLEMNGYRVVASEVEAVEETLGLAARKVSESEFAEWLRRNVSKKRSSSRKKS